MSLPSEAIYPNVCTPHLGDPRAETRLRLAFFQLRHGRPFAVISSHKTPRSALLTELHTKLQRIMPQCTSRSLLNRQLNRQLTFSSPAWLIMIALWARLLISFGGGSKLKPMLRCITVLTTGT